MKTQIKFITKIAIVQFLIFHCMLALMKFTGEIPYTESLLYKVIFAIVYISFYTLIFPTYYFIGGYQHGEESYALEVAISILNAFCWGVLAYLLIAARSWIIEKNSSS